MRINKLFTRLTGRAADLSGRPSVFIIMLVAIAIWGALGPHYSYSDTWQLIINTSTTIVTCLLAFLIQASTNRSELAIQTKLDELLLSHDHQHIVGIEHLTIGELLTIREAIELKAQERRDADV